MSGMNVDLYRHPLRKHLAGLVLNLPLLLLIVSAWTPEPRTTFIVLVLVGPPAALTVWHLGGALWCGHILLATWRKR
jgi:hypothetical protein